MPGHRTTQALRRSALAAALVASMVSLATASPADAAPGDLDPTFNGGTALEPSGTGTSVVGQPDGKLVVGAT